MCSSEFNLQGTNMDYLQSKELLSEVLGKEVTNIQKGCTENELKITAYFGNVRQSFHINIYELAHKYKEWAKSQKLFILSFPSPNEGLEGYWANLTNNTHRAFAATEPEAIFKACQWILDNRN